MLGFMDLRQPKVSRLVTVKIMTCKKKFTPTNKYKNRAYQILESLPDQYWSDINLTLLCQLANRSLIKSGRDWRWITFSERPGEAGGRRQPGTTARRSQQQLGKKNIELLYFQIKVHEHKNCNNHPTSKSKDKTPYNKYKLRVEVKSIFFNSIPIPLSLIPIPLLTISFNSNSGNSNSNSGDFKSQQSQFQKWPFVVFLEIDNNYTDNVHVYKIIIINTISLISQVLNCYNCMASWLILYQ